MKIKLLVYLIFWTIFSFGQSLDTIKRIEVFYGYGNHCFSRNGVYSRSEKFTFEKSENNFFYLTNYSRFWKKSQKKGKVFTKDSTVSLLSKQIDSKLIAGLIANLNTDEQNFSFKFLKSRLKEPEKRQIKRLAKERDLYYKIECDGLFDCEYRNQTIDSIKHFEHFDKFVSSLNLLPIQMVVIGYWHQARITFFSEKGSVAYDFSFMDNKAGQPIIKHYNTNFTSKYGFVNLKANEIIRDILPKESITFKAFDLKHITDDYINWYLKKY